MKNLKKKYLSVLLLLPIIVGKSGCSCDKLVTESSDLKAVHFIEQQTHDLINAVRKDYGLQELQWSETIAGVARGHSSQMASGKVGLGHSGFKSRAKTLSMSISWMGIAENVAYNMGYSDPSPNIVDGWMKSDVHRHNILGDYNITGIGVVVNVKGEYYFSQIFAKLSNDVET